MLGNTSLTSICTYVSDTLLKLSHIGTYFPYLIRPAKGITYIDTGSTQLQLPSICTYVSDTFIQSQLPEGITYVDADATSEY